MELEDIAKNTEKNSAPKIDSTYIEQKDKKPEYEPEKPATHRVWNF